jgi:hypothetical protein
MEIADAQEKAIAFSKDNVPRLHLRLVTRQYYSNLVCCRKITPPPVHPGSHPKTYCSLFCVWVLAENLVCM